MPTFPTPGPIRVTIEAVIGDIRIVASDRTETVVDVRPRSNSKPADVRAAQQTTVEYANDRLLIRGAIPRFSVFGPKGAIDVTVALPAGSQLRGETMLGDLRAEGPLGECKLKTAMGSISLEQAAALIAESAYGDITADRVTGRAEITSSSGAIRLGVVDGAVTVKNSNGSIDVGEAAGELRLNSANGEISVDRAHAGVVAKTANGSIRIKEIVRGSILIETAYGGLEVGIREGTAAWLDVRSQYGRVRNDLRSADGSTPTAETAEVRAYTAYGDILIRRSTRPATPTGNQPR